jgi:hypothetical protein
MTDLNASQLKEAILRSLKETAARFSARDGTDDAARRAPPSPDARPGPPGNGGPAGEASGRGRA